MNSTLERMARVLCEASRSGADSEVHSDDAWQAYVPAARAALEAIREPSRGMTEAGAEIIRNVGPSESDEAHQSDAANTWRFMVDAALNDH